MAEKTITTQVTIDGGISPDFSFDWEVEFKGEKYIMPLRKPQASKQNTSFYSTIDLTFHHWAVYQLKRWYFFTVQPVQTGTAVPDMYIAPVSLNLKDFCSLFNQVLEYYFNGKITLDFNDPATHENGWAYSQERTTVEISHSYIWDVLIKFYELFAVRWVIEPNGDIDHYVIKVGYPTTDISHIFRYGFEGGLLKVERQVQDDNIRNMIIGRGGSNNLPYRYFKKQDDDNKTFSPDPDWIPELKDIYFQELRGATFRSYIQGWKAAHIEQYRKDYPDEKWIVTAPDKDKAYAPWAWEKGYTDEKFNPVEYVADEIVAIAETGDKYVEISPDYMPAVKGGSSIDKYGPLMGGLDNNEEIYPTIQGIQDADLGRLDETVGVQPITSDDVAEAAQNEATFNVLSGCSGVVSKIMGHTTKTIRMSGDFTVPDNRYANLNISIRILYVRYWNQPYSQNLDIPSHAMLIEGSQIVKVFNTETGEEHTSGAIPSGQWHYQVYVDVENISDDILNITAGDEHPELTDAMLEENWGETWDIWVKNIWGTEKGINEDGKLIPGETDAQYAERVWLPILGDRIGQSAKVVFSDGRLSTSEDYEFIITKIPVFDPSKTFSSSDGRTYISHWRITLAKSDADLEATGLYLPSTRRQAKAGDHIFFTGIDMPHLYVVKAEERLDDWKKDELQKVRDIKPVWVVGLDKIRISQRISISLYTPEYMGLEQGGLLKLEDGGFLKLEETARLIDLLRPGNRITLSDKRFMDGALQEKLYIQSCTYTFRQATDTDAALLPDVSIVLSDSYSSSANSVATLQGNINAIQRQLGSISNIERLVMDLCDRRYMRKDGFPDNSMSPSTFASLLTSSDFRSGIIGGRGWGFFKDEDGNWNLHVDRLGIRQSMSVNDFVINQITARSGMIIDSSAQMKVTRVDDTAAGYVCWFDQKGGSVENQFIVDDIALCNRFTPENLNLKFYKRRVIAVSPQNITLSKTDVNGDGIPAAEDVLVQYGNYKPESGRTFVKVLDIFRGGYERYIQGLTSVNTDGEEYFFAGRADGQPPRLLIGDKNGQYAEWKDGVLEIVGKLSVKSYIGDKTVSEILDGADFKYIKDALLQDTIAQGGLVLSTLIKLGTDNSDPSLHVTNSGISGIYDAAQKGFGIAAWFGGDMIDGQIEGNKDNPRRARTIFRMDGTGYLADGNLWWDELGNLTLGSGITVEGLDGSLKGTLSNILNAISAINSILTPLDIDGKVVPLKMDELEKRAVLLRSKLTIASYGDVSAFGDAASGGGGAQAYERLDNWADYDMTKSGYVLSAALGFDLYQRVTELESGGLDTVSLAQYLDTHNYLTKGVADGLYQPFGDYLTNGDLAGYATTAWADQKFLGKSDYASILDSRYYSETEIDNILSGFLPKSGGTITGILAFERPGATRGFYIEALDDGSLLVNGTVGGNYSESFFTFEASKRQFTFPSAYIGESLSLGNESKIYGSLTVADSERIYLNHAKTVWVRYNASLNVIEASHTIVSAGDITAFSK